MTDRCYVSMLGCPRDPPAMIRALQRHSLRAVFAAALAALVAPAAPWTIAHAQRKAETWERAFPGYHFEFPRDHFNHPGYQTEWWYYTGNLRSQDGRRFGFELTFFRQGIARPIPSGQAGSTWDVADLYLAHLALSDLDGRRFYHTERLNRAGPGLAGADLGSRHIWNGNWQVRFDESSAGAQPVQDLQAVCDDFTLHLTLHSAKSPVIHGVDGVSQKAPGRGQASHYISYTRLEAAGSLELEGRAITLAGLAWMDHEFFSHQLTPDQTGWDWISIQLDEGEELMLYRLRRRDGTVDPFSAGSFVDARGAARHLAAGEFSMESGATWTSPATSARYPVQWTIRVPSLGIELAATTPLEDQELVSRRANWPTYWEGAITLRGKAHGQPASGVGYLEMTGYDRAVELAR
jgi:predicted secreted hydrolase